MPTNILFAGESLIFFNPPPTFWAEKLGRHLGASSNTKRILIILFEPDAITLWLHDRILYTYLHISSLNSTSYLQNSLHQNLLSIVIFMLKLIKLISFICSLSVCMLVIKSKNSESVVSSYKVYEQPLDFEYQSNVCKINVESLGK